MNNVTVYPGRVSGILAAPLSLEEAQRAIILAAITKTSVRIIEMGSENAEMFNALFEMGARFRQEDGTVTFYAAPESKSAIIKCGRKTLELILPLSVILGGKYTFIGEYKSDYSDYLENMDVKIDSNPEGITVCSSLNTNVIRLEDDTFLSGFLLCLPILKDATVYCAGNCYEALSLQLLKMFGYTISELGGYSIKSCNPADQNFVYGVGGDYGRAAYLLLSGFIGGEVGVTGLLADSMQPKKSIIEEYINLKLSVQELNGAVFAKKSRLTADVIDISKSSEPAAVLTLCCFGRGRCLIKNEELLLANDREEFELVLAGLKNIGADIIRIGGNIFVTGRKKIIGGNADANDSEKASMAFAAAGLVSEIGVNIDNAKGLEKLVAVGATII